MEPTPFYARVRSIRSRDGHTGREVDGVVGVQAAGASISQECHEKALRQSPRDLRLLGGRLLQKVGIQ